MDELTRYRMRVLAVVAISLFAALVARLWYLQVITTEQAVAVAEQNVTREIRVTAPRGRILDVQGGYWSATGSRRWSRSTDGSSIRLTSTRNTAYRC